MRATDAVERTQSWVGRIADVDSLGAVAATVASSVCLAAGVATLTSNGADPIAEPMLALLLPALIGLAVQVRMQDGTWSRSTLVVAGMAAAGLVFLLLIPEWLYGYNLNAIIHHSLFSTLLLLGVGTVGLSQSLFYVLGATPSARDAAVYPLLLLPICAALLAYGMILGRVVSEGIGGLGIDALTTAYTQSTTESSVVREAGLRNHIIGTLLLLAMTIGIALPIGVGSGVYMSEYPGWTASVIGFCATMLRSISLFIIGATALNLVELTDLDNPGNALTTVIRGSYTDEGGFKRAGNGSFVLAACFLAILVIPVIARSTVEGLRSVPHDVREGVVSLGATDGHNLVNVFLPWAFPLIVTGVLVAAAEAAGSTAILLFISGTGENGVGPLHETVTLDFLIFQTRYGPDPFIEQMRQYQYTAALLLLLLTLSLTAGALYLRARARRRYIGTYSS